MRAITKQEDSASGVSVAVPKSITKNKPKQNRLKRRLYFLIKRNWPLFKAVEAIIFLKKEGKNCSNAQLEESLKILLGKINNRITARR